MAQKAETEDITVHSEEQEVAVVVSVEQAAMEETVQAEPVVEVTVFPGRAVMVVVHMEQGVAEVMEQVVQQVVQVE